MSADPHVEHWQALAKAAETINASPNCGPEQASEFCCAVDRLSAALMGEPMSRDEIAVLTATIYLSDHDKLTEYDVAIIRAYEAARGIK